MSQDNLSNDTAPESTEPQPTATTQTPPVNPIPAPPVAMPENKAITRIGVEYYMSKRVDEQIAYFNRKSSEAQRKFKRQKRIEFILALSVPVLVTFSTMEVAKKAVFFHVSDAPVNLDLVIQISAAIAGIVMAYYNKVMDLEEYFKVWKENRVNCEALEHERYSYLTRTGDYEDEQSAFSKFVDKIESILNNDVQKWKQRNKDEQGQQQQSSQNGKQANTPDKKIEELTDENQ